MQLVIDKFSHGFPASQLSDALWSWNEHNLEIWNSSPIWDFITKLAGYFSERRTPNVKRGMTLSFVIRVRKLSEPDFISGPYTGKTVLKLDLLNLRTLITKLLTQEFAYHWLRTAEPVLFCFSFSIYNVTLHLYWIERVPGVEMIMYNLTSKASESLLTIVHTHQ